MVQRFNFAVVKHRVRAAKDKVNVAAYTAILIILLGVQARAVLAWTAEAVLLAFPQGERRGKQRVLVAVQVHTLHQHAASVGVNGQRLAHPGTVTGGILHGKVLYDGLAAA